MSNTDGQMVEDEPKASVHNLQTLLLINHFSRSYCSLKEHGISQVYYITDGTVSQLMYRSFIRLLFT
jgi:hypothetical protein